MSGTPPTTETTESAESRYEYAYGDLWYWWRNLTYLLREQFLFGVAIFLVIFVVDFSLYKLATRIYQSQASFVVDQSPFEFAVNQNDVEGSRLLLQSIVSSITSFDMRQVIADRLKVSPGNVCILGLGPPALSLKKPNQVNISVTSERGSRVATILALSSNPQFASDAANAVLDEILGLNRLVGRLNDVSRQITAEQAEVDQYAQNVSAADASLSQLEQDVLGIEQHEKAGGSLESAPAFAQDPELLDLQKKRIDADAAYSAETQISVQGQQLQALAGAKKSIDLQIEEYLRNRVIAVHSNYDEAKARVAALKADLKQQVDTLNDLQNEKTELSKAVGDFKLRRNLGLFDTDAKSSEAGVIVVFDRARPAWKATKPSLIVYIAAGAGLSLLLCCGLMFFRHNLDRTIKYPQQIEIASGVPCLAVLPEPTVTRKGQARAYVPERDTVAGLSYLRNQILRSSLMGRQSRIISFVDLGESGSSSDWVAQLGWLLASAEKPTLLVDLDFDNPRLADVLQIPQERGLSEWVRSTSSLSNFIQKSEVAELGLLQPGKDLKDLDIHLSRKPLAPELEKLQDTWPFILIYAPSLLEIPHLLLAAPGDTPVISLAHYGKATLDDLDEMIGRCESCHFKFAGVVLHHFPVKRFRTSKSLFGLGPHRYIFGPRLSLNMR